MNPGRKPTMRLTLKDIDRLHSQLCTCVVTLLKVKGPMVWDNIRKDLVASGWFRHTLEEGDPRDKWKLDKRPMKGKSEDECNVLLLESGGYVYRDDDFRYTLCVANGPSRILAKQIKKKKDNPKQLRMFGEEDG
jgi:hypothetical protein